jgi:hypothetical protein
MTKETTVNYYQLIGFAITIIGSCLIFVVNTTNKVTAVEVRQKTLQETDVRIEAKIDKLIDAIIYNKK